ncbi:MAG: hypothetical protein RLZ84_666, partial [Actinomycetota bacterium]
MCLIATNAPCTVTVIGPSLPGATYLATLPPSAKQETHQHHDHRELRGIRGRASSVRKFWSTLCVGRQRGIRSLTPLVR